ncbi:MAG: hypothetical protein HN985_03715 [Planctomycetaceae bacterium]|nr:hypothetical protein [Planctomycetaceae bacterium]MBT6918808.1 hypothetical protein [Planctomycetaceae bacterium]
MQRFTSMLLLSVYGIVSLLGHAGFDVLGLHSHGRTDAEHAHHAVKCSHCQHGHKAVEHSEDNSQPSPEHADDCSICKCFSLLKTQVGASKLPTVKSVPFCCESSDLYERLATFDFTLLPKPRGPPALQV